jgi:hypothetical protein
MRTSHSTTRTYALAYLLLERKSSADAGTPLQLLRYIVRILAKWYDEHERLPLPMVLPLVAHQGPGDWTSSTAFIDLFGSVPEPLRPYLVSFRHVLVDLPHIRDEALSIDTRLGAYLKALKYARRQDLAEHLAVILVPELADMDMVRILGYIDRGPIFVSNGSLQAPLRLLERNRRENIMGHFSREFEAIGEARGEARGRASSLLRLLEKRFGTVSSRLRERIITADVDSIEAWFDEALDTQDLKSVFGTSEIG